mgnify:CR=1 FL=1
MTSVYFHQEDLVQTYKNYLDQLKFEPLPTAKVSYVKAIPCALNQGVLNEKGELQPKNFIYVDDCWLIALAGG